MPLWNHHKLTERDVFGRDLLSLQKEATRFIVFQLCFFQRDHEKMKITREREEKLIVSAWYEMVSTICYSTDSESLYSSQVTHPTGPDPGFHSTKRLGAPQTPPAPPPWIGCQSIARLPQHFIRLS